MSEIPPVNHSWVDRNVEGTLDGTFWNWHNKEVRRAEYYVKIAHTVASRSNCLVRRGFGAVIVKDDQIVSTGYSGSARGTLNCGKDIPCIKNKRNLPANAAYELCPSIHAEENAVIHAGRSRALGQHSIYLLEEKRLWETDPVINVEGLCSMPVSRIVGTLVQTESLYMSLPKNGSS